MGLMGQLLVLTLSFPAVGVLLYLLTITERRLCGPPAATTARGRRRPAARSASRHRHVRPRQAA